MTVRHAARPVRSEVEPLERRVVLSGYAAMPVAALPALASSTFNNAAEEAQLVRDGAGNLYGFDPLGGPNGTGTIFEVNPTTGAMTTLVTEGTTGNLYPLQLGIDAGGDLFGIAQDTAVTGTGAAAEPTGFDTLFELPAASPTTPVTLYTFNDTTVGEFPRAIQVDTAGDVYALTSYAAANDGGSIVKFTAAAYATPAVLGSLPNDYHDAPSNFVVAADGDIYGTTAGGGDSGQGGDGDGTLFELAAGSSTVNTIADFTAATTGYGPEATPYVDAAGDVFGTCQSGGSGSSGTVWEYAAATTTLGPVASFAGGGIIGPVGGVVPDASGDLLGTAVQDEGSGAGGVFEVAAGTGALSTVATFDSTTVGSASESSLTPDGSGDYYGITTAGGANGRGAVFELAPAAGTTPTPTPTPTPTSTATPTPTVARSKLPASVVAGSTVKGTVTVTVTNGGTATSTGLDTVGLYATTDGVVDAASTLVGSVSRKLTLRAGKSATLTVAVEKALSLPAGQYTILAQTTGSAGTAATATGPALAVAAPVVSLSLVAGSVRPTAVAVGKSFTLSLTVTNGGNIDSTGVASVAVGLSSDGATLAVPLTTVSRSVKVKAGGRAVAVRLALKVPVGTAAGGYHPFVTFTQGTSSETTIGTTVITIG